MSSLFRIDYYSDTLPGAFGPASRNIGSIVGNW